MPARQSTAPESALSSTEALADALLGMAWFNGLTPVERALWLTRAGSSCPADAWELFKATTR